ncbi:MAG: Rieske (2Fe-2S) protein [Candidatus Bipolaricaulia bacterium]
MAEGEFVKVATTDELEPGGYISHEVDDELIAIYYIDGNYYVTQDICTHDGGILTGGTLEGMIITCPRHGAQFDITTGEVVRMPAFEPIQTLEIKVDGSDILVRLE